MTIVSQFKKIYSPFAFRSGPFFSFLSFWKQLYFKMTGIRIKICGQKSAYGRVVLVVVEGQGSILP